MMVVASLLATGGRPMTPMSSTAPKPIIPRQRLDGDSTVPRAAGAREVDGPVLIEVRGLEKTFRIPKHRVDTLKERVVHPLTRAEYRELRALREISFDVREGEFFGIVGRNGSGKSTLLKILASIYRADRGTIRMAGRLAPFIELGVGFNAELTARENVVLNGVLMGLSRREAARRLDAVLDFAGLREFVDLKLKNYSSGMMVRLAFSVMVEADADIMLVDEVLAVGDASFAQKCMDVFREKRRAGKTLVLVTHDMATVQSLCDRAMLIHDGEMRYLGDPGEAVLRYFRLNFGGAQDHDPAKGGAVPDVNVRLVDVWLENDAGERIDNVAEGDVFSLCVTVQAREVLFDPIFGFDLLNVDGVTVFGFGKTLSEADDEPGRIAAGQRAHIAARIENPLVPGRYSIECSIARNRTAGDVVMQNVRLLDFLVQGSKPTPGMVSVRTALDATVER
jgi:ABC-type polysaccharide/polyol phosphate transport system ATPase subunit